VLETLLLHDWGCIVGASDDVSHQKLAYVMRALIFASGQFCKTQGALTLAEIAVRVGARVARYMVPVVNQVSGEKRVANLALKATLCFIFSSTPAPTVDTLAAAWNISEVVPGWQALGPAVKLREGVASRIAKRYGAKLSAQYAEFLTIMMCLLYDALLKFTLTEDDVDAATMWTTLFQHEVGTLRQFLGICELIADDNNSTTTTAGDAASKRPLASRSKKAGIPSALRDPKMVFLSAKKSMTTSKALPTVRVPVTGTRGRAVDNLKNIAAEEILSAIPTQPVPMYVGDVGNLIGIWSKFNAKYDGVLGQSLIHFLEEREEDFQVVGNVVTRKIVGRGEQVRIRFDNVRESDSDDDNGQSRRMRDRRLLTGEDKRKKLEGGQRAKHSKARRKQDKKDKNNARFNKNRQAFDPSSKVPGYVKHGPRKLKGRGVKTNIRNFKRAA
jgi:hypothetical protein